ncbi:hypothetical protein B0H13DRAFT_2344683 [Mycena leptocephala]|nr:hypothetical protein B0H13DRAFT_2344683 [Mycena leptocephala]
MAPKDTGKGLNESTAEFHERLVQMNGADAEGLSEDNQILRKAKREAEEKRLRDEEARRLWELQEKKREDDERKQKEAEKARKKAEKGKEKKKRDRDGAAVSDEGETDVLKRKKPKVGEYDPKVRKIRGSMRPPARRPQPRMRCVLQGKGKVQPVRRGLRCGTVGLAGAFQGLSDSVDEFLVEQRAQWEWERKEKELHDGHVEKSFDNIEKLLGQQVLASQASAGALQHMARMLEAFVRRSSPDFMTAMPAGPPDYIPISSRWKKKKPAERRTRRKVDRVNLCDFVLEFTFNFNRRRRRPNTSGYSVGMSGFELGDMKYWVVWRMSRGSLTVKEAGPGWAITS